MQVAGNFFVVLVFYFAFGWLLARAVDTVGLRFGASWPTRFAAVIVISFVAAWLAQKVF